MSRRTDGHVNKKLGSGRLGSRMEKLYCIKLSREEELLPAVEQGGSVVVYSWIKGTSLANLNLSRGSLCGEVVFRL